MMVQIANLLIVLGLVLQADGDARALETLATRVAAYVELHRREEARLPALDPASDAAQISRHQVALAARLGSARHGAREGDIFVPEAAARLRRILAPHFAGAEGARARAAMFEEMPARVLLRVNEIYPDVPLAIVPPRILNDLPRLPEELEYRFIGRYLILRDVHANTVVDFAADVIP